MLNINTAIGGSRFVVLIGNLVIKFPRPNTFQRGRKQNTQEWQHRNKSSHLAKLYFSFPFGMCNIMQRAILFDRDVTKDVIRDYFKNKIRSKEELEFILEDSRTGNFGVVAHKVVKIDWGGI